ncbi:response regulator [Streptomyces sp. NPDC058045]|uniref:response regulator n=1 Tax=Streptomyces sp. NPDC058045 TaxID=3346311 RepID=UPI0036E94401
MTTTSMNTATTNTTSMSTATMTTPSPPNTGTPSTSTPTTVLIVDDQPLLRHSLARIIDAEPDLSVTGHAGDGEEALVAARQLAPDVVLMDIRMPGADGITATRSITTDPALGHTRVLVLTMFDHDEYLTGALRAGAAGFVLKDSRPDQLTDAIRRTRDGEALFAPQVLDRFVDTYLAGPTPRAAAPDVLTPRETETLALVARGLTNKEIADQLTISQKTVKTHIGHLLSKLEARDRAGLVIAAYRFGLAHPTPPP